MEANNKKRIRTVPILLLVFLVGACGTKKVILKEEQVKMDAEEIKKEKESIVENYEWDFENIPKEVEEETAYKRSMAGDGFPFSTKDSKIIKEITLSYRIFCPDDKQIDQNSFQIFFKKKFTKADINVKMYKTVDEKKGVLKKPRLIFNENFDYEGEKNFSTGGLYKSSHIDVTWYRNLIYVSPYIIKKDEYGEPYRKEKKISKNNLYGTFQFDIRVHFAEHNITENIQVKGFRTTSKIVHDAAHEAVRWHYKMQEEDKEGRPH